VGLISGVGNGSSQKGSVGLEWGANDARVSIQFTVVDQRSVLGF
jgi:hypothetical protein